MNNRQLGWVYWVFVIVFAVLIMCMGFCPLWIKILVTIGTLIITFYQFKWDKELYQ